MSEEVKEATNVEAALDNKDYSVKQLVTLMAKRGYNRSDAKTAIDDILDCIKQSLINEKSVKLIGFGTFTPEIVAPREMLNPLNGKTITTKPRRKIKFKMSSTLKDPS